MKTIENFNCVFARTTNILNLKRDHVTEESITKMTEDFNVEAVFVQV